MKKPAWILTVTLLLMASSTSWACDDILKVTVKDARQNALFARDCKIQDRFRSLRQGLQQQQINLNDVAEYRAIRFIDRANWERAKKLSQSPDQIYGPAPISWNVWSEGIDKLFPTSSVPGRLTKGELYSSKGISEINKMLLSNGTDSIKDARTDEEKQPGEYRQEGDAEVAFCAHDSADYRTLSDQSLESMQREQKNWEAQFGMKFEKLVVKENGLNSGLATFGATLRGIAPGCGPKGDGTHVSYVRSVLVPSHVNWIQIFLKANLDRYEMKKPLIAPIAMSALVQKWLVTVHPFADGNGRTSRGLQDLILEHFDLPFAPGGDLQNDASEDYNKYVDQTYEKMEAMLTKLESCLSEVQSGGPLSFECKSYQTLNQK